MEADDGVNEVAVLGIALEKCAETVFGAIWVGLIVLDLPRVEVESEPRKKILVLRSCG